MNIDELRKLISEASESEWFNKVNTPLNLPSVNFSHTFVGIPELFMFVDNQCNEWELAEVDKKNLFTPSINYFVDFRTGLIQAITLMQNYNESQRNSTWQNNILQKTYKNLQQIFLNECPEVTFLMKVHHDYPTAFQGAYNFITGVADSAIINTKENFIGTLLAYEFTLKDHTQITERRNAEKRSINSLRSNFERYSSENETFMLAFRKDMSERLSNQDKEFVDLKEEKIKEFDEGLEIKKTIFDTWYNSSTSEYSVFYKASQEKVIELENTYSEKLKLEEPAKYWSDRAIDLKGQAWRAMYILIGLTIFAAIFLGVVLWNSPDSILASWFDNDKSAAIRWSLVFITLLSLIAYGIRAISKVMFSSFHLARDCEERYTLTYFYLALMKDSNVDPKDRNLIMQSLFSRSDTGLLKEDSSPTMPGVGGVIGNFVGKPN